MFKKKLMAVMMSAFCLAAAIPSVPVMADGQKVVTLGVDLSEDQRTMILKYFGIYGEDVETLYINNTDEREHLAAYVPIEQIGTHTYSCALVNPTSSGGIQVKTANLTWVTSNMIASTLSTSGVVNCEVLAASPFPVSGTGALTGIIMAYEAASGENLDEAKKDAATKELVTTTSIANDVGQTTATQIVNETKIQVIQGETVSTDEIKEIVEDTVQKTEISLSQEDKDLLVDLLETLAGLDYDYDEMKETLDRVEQNVADIAEQEQEINIDISIINENQNNNENSNENNNEVSNDNSNENSNESSNENNNNNSSDSSSSADTDVTADSSSNSDSSSASDSSAVTDTTTDSFVITEDSIFNDVDNSALGADVEFSSTYEDPTLETEAKSDIEEENSETVEPEEEEFFFEITSSDSYGDSEGSPSGQESSGSSEDIQNNGNVFEITDEIPYEEEITVDLTEGVPSEENGSDLFEEFPEDFEEEYFEEETEEDIIAEETEVFPVSELKLIPNTDKDDPEPEKAAPGLNYLTVQSSMTDLEAGSGYISIYNAENDELIETIWMDDEESVVFEEITDVETLEDLGWNEGIEVRIILSDPLEADSAYYVMLSEDAFNANDGTLSSGASEDHDEWAFMTAAYGISVEETAKGVEAGDPANVNLFMDPDADYAVVECISPDGSRIDAGEFMMDDSFQIIFNQTGKNTVRVSYYNYAAAEETAEPEGFDEFVIEFEDSAEFGESGEFEEFAGPEESVESDQPAEPISEAEYIVNVR